MEECPCGRSRSSATGSRRTSSRWPSGSTSSSPSASGTAGLHDRELRACPTEPPTSPSRIASAHPEHRPGGFRPEVDPDRTSAVNHLMTSNDHWMLNKLTLEGGAPTTGSTPRGLCADASGERNSVAAGAQRGARPWGRPCPAWRARYSSSKRLRKTGVTSPLRSRTNVQTHR